MKAGKRIKMLRTSKGLTQEHIAQYLGVTREFISMIENNDRDPGLERLEKLADLFGVDLVDLIDDNSDNVKVATSLAFRADEVNVSDLDQIAKFQGIIRNYLKMKSIFKQSDKGHE